MSIPKPAPNPGRGRGTGGAVHFAAAVALGGLSCLIVEGFFPQAPALLIGWVVLSAVFSVWTWVSIRSFDGDTTATMAQREDLPGSVLRDVLLIAIALVALLTVALVVFRAREAGWPLTLLGIASITSSWVMLHTIMALRYARLFYTDPVGGIDFPQTPAPCYADFAYLAFTVGMTFQTSDTAIADRRIRSSLLGHALVSFVFATFIVAITVNLVAGLSV
jgi:uncharacterized membrane protein